MVCFLKVAQQGAAILLAGREGNNSHIIRLVFFHFSSQQKNLDAINRV